MNNTTGNKLILTVTGSSHGEFVGGILRNYPEGIAVDYDLIANDLQRRKPHVYGTPRKESDEVNFLSGITDGITNGRDIEFRVTNNNVIMRDYSDFSGFFRPSHADYPYYIKYGEDSLRYKDMASARMFLPVVIAGCFAKMLLKQNAVTVCADVVEIGGIDCLNNKEAAENLLKTVLLRQDTVGGKIKCVISGLKAGFGEPIFDKISANLAKAVMNIPSCVSFSIGDTENRDKLPGSEDIDNWKEDFTTVTNHSGGMNAGISNGMPIVFFAGFHAVHTLQQEMTLISEKGNLIKRKINGRHDICSVLRTPVIVESAAALTIIDYIL